MDSKRLDSDNDRSLKAAAYKNLTSRTVSFLAVLPSSVGKLTLTNCSVKCSLTVRRKTGLGQGEHIPRILDC